VKAPARVGEDEKKNEKKKMRGTEKLEQSECRLQEESGRYVRLSGAWRGRHVPMEAGGGEIAKSKPLHR
jgi:hypothetical protein